MCQYLSSTFNQCVSSKEMNLKKLNLDVTPRTFWRVLQNFSNIQQNEIQSCLWEEHW